LFEVNYDDENVVLVLQLIDGEITLPSRRREAGRINHVRAANKGENQVGAIEQGFRGVCAIRL